jgi:hypothetical protein
MYCYLSVVVTDSIVQTNENENITRGTKKTNHPYLHFNIF